MKLINNYKGKVRPRHNKHVLKINALKTIRKNRNRLTIIGAKHIADTICVLDRLSGAMFPQGVCQFSIDTKSTPMTEVLLSLSTPTPATRPVINCIEQAKRS